MTRLYLILILALAVLGACSHEAESDGVTSATDESATSTFEGARVLTNSGYYNEALKLWVRFLAQAEEDPRVATPQNLMTAYLALGSIHYDFQDYETALSFSMKGEEIGRETNDTSAQMRFLNNMTGILVELGQYSRADSCNNELGKLMTASGNKDYTTNHAFNKGYIAKGQRRYADALKMMYSSLDSINKYDLGEQRKAYAYSELFSIYDDMNRRDSAMEYLRKYEDLLTIPSMQMDCYKEAMHFMTKIGNNAEALRYQELYFALADSVMNARDFMETRNLYLNRERDKSTRSIATLQGTVSRQKAVLGLVLVAAVFLVAIALIIYFQNRRLNRAYAELYAHNKELLAMRDEYKRKRTQMRNMMPQQEPAVVPAVPLEPQNAAAPEAEDADGKDDTAAEEKVLAEGAQQLLDRIIDVMDNTTEYCNPEFSLQKLAKLTDSNTKYVSAVINESLNKNFRTFVNEYRVNLAQHRMMDKDGFGHLTIQSIGESVGFKSPANFIAAFKKVTGINPSVYMKMARSDKQ